MDIRKEGSLQMTKTHQGVCEQCSKAFDRQYTTRKPTICITCKDDNEAARQNKHQKAKDIRKSVEARAELERLEAHLQALPYADAQAFLRDLCQQALMNTLPIVQRRALTCPKLYKDVAKVEPDPFTAKHIIMRVNAYAIERYKMTFSRLCKHDTTPLTVSTIKFNLDRYNPNRMREFDDEPPAAAAPRELEPPVIPKAPKQQEREHLMAAMLGDTEEKPDWLVWD